MERETESRQKESDNTGRKYLQQCEKVNIFNIFFKKALVLVDT